MFEKISLIIVIVIGCLFVGTAAFADEASADATDPTKVLVIYDSSNSMWGELSDKSRKYEAGRSALGAFLATEFGTHEVGFRPYGHRRKTDCRDSELLVPFSEPSVAKTKITSAIENIRPTGKTPITYSLKEGLKDLDGEPGDILLISDGIETCDIDPCELMREWRAANVNIRVHVVGVGLSELEQAAMACIADVSGGKYFDADSSDRFAEALTEAGEAIDEPVSANANPVELAQGYALRIRATDDQGRSFIVIGKLLKDGEEIADVTSNGRNVIEAPGDYTIEVGPVLRDGSIYEPVAVDFRVTEPGDVTVDVTVTRPAIVFASFLENGEEHRGSQIVAYQNGKEMFKFRASDEALARPGEYEFRASPNDDNKLKLIERLNAGEETELVFELINTIQFYVRFVLPDGQKFRRGSELWRDGKKVYSVFSGNPTTIQPGVYELRSDNQNLPLTPIEIEISEDGKTYEVPVDAGWVVIKYKPDDFNYISEPDRANLESLDRGGSKYAGINTAIPVLPGRYRANPHTARGFFDAIDFEVATNETVEVEFIPKPLGEIIVNYAASDLWPRQPDRASVYPAEGQKMLNGFMRPGVAKKFLPGRYSVKGGGSGGGNAAPQEVTVIAGKTVTVILQPAAE